MKQNYISGFETSESCDIKIIESNGEKSVLINGWTYMKWRAGDDIAQRIAIVQLYQNGLGTKEELTKVFELHINTVQNYINDFAESGGQGLMIDKSGPKESWKINSRVRAKILMIVLKTGICKYELIQKRLEEWNEHISIESIRQVLIENGLVDKNNAKDEVEIKQGDIFKKDCDEEQINFNFNCNTEFTKINNTEKTDTRENEKQDDAEVENNHFGKIKAMRYYSSGQRIYLNQLEYGDYNSYAGGLLFNPLLEKYSLISNIKRIVDIETYEGYSLEELCVTLFYFDVFNYKSMEDFKRVYPEEFGILIGRTCSPSHFTLRRFLHKIRELEISEKLIDEIAVEYLKSGIARYGVVYIDAHFYAYLGLYLISMGWHGVRKIPMKGSYIFLGVDEKFIPWIFLIRSSSEDLLQKIPEIVEKIIERERPDAVLPTLGGQTALNVTV